VRAEGEVAHRCPNRACPSRGLETLQHWVGPALDIEGVGGNTVHKLWEEALVRSLGGTPAAVSLFDADALARAAEGAQVVIHAATAIPTGLDARSPGAWEMNDRIRREGTRALTAAAGRVGARRYLQQSVAWVVKTAPGGPFYDESTPPDPPALLRSAVDGEQIAHEAGALHGFRVGVLRAGVFYGPDTAHLRAMAGLLRRRRLPIPGRGDHLVAMIHVEDVARAFAMAAEAEGAEGTWHVLDDAPVPYAEMVRHFAALLGAPAPRRLPLWVARLLLGRGATESLTTSMNTSSAKIRRELGWAPRYPTYREGLAQVLAAWREEGFPAASRAGTAAGNAGPAAPRVRAAP
jgi:nucleoside-diphosphate-sugar epimerase